MGVKKVKISSVKRAQHLKTKKNFTKSQPKKKESKITDKGQKIIFPKTSTKKEKSKQQRQHFIGNQNDDDDDDDDDQIIENIADVIDPEDLELLDLSIKRSRKRKYEDNRNENDKEATAEQFEREHAENVINENKDKKLIVNLLPIKNQDGQIITRTAKIDYKARESQNNDQVPVDNVNDDEEEFEDSDDDIVEDKDGNKQKILSKKVISNADLLILREQEFERQKYRIGIICSGILEKPENKMKNFRALFDLMEENNENGDPNLFSVRKIAIISIAEVFKDILPEYRVGQVDTKMTVVRKTTLERVTYENTLLQQFKKYLKKLEKVTNNITKKGGKRTQETIKIAETAVTCLCELLLSHPYFNYVQNIAQLLVYILNCRYQNIREIVNECFRNFFKIDKKLDMTLFIVRRMNHLIKTKSNDVHIEMVTCLLGLNIKNINLDAEKENELKQKKLEAHRQRLLNLSKREKKRRKRLAELNRELDETKAEENKQTKHYKLTEITKMLFTIYFRILKNDPNSKLLSACLEGLAEFAHVINLDFFSDLIEVLNRLLESDELGYREQLHCIQTIFVILSGQGEVLNIDPIRFYGHLYRNLLVVHAGKNHNDFLIILKTLNEVLIKRRKNITQQRLLAFIKRLLTLSLQLLHNGSLASLGIIKTVMQLTSVLDIILDTDSSVGTGRFNSEIDDPEYCNASCTSLYELTMMMRHYHPTVRKFAMHIASGVPAIGDGSLPSELGKLTPEELFAEFDSSQMAFNPSIPPPKVCEPKLKKTKQIFMNPVLKQHCVDKIKGFSSESEIIDFYESYRNE